MPVSVPLEYRVNDFPVWCTEGQATQPGFPFDAEFRIDVGAPFVGRQGDLTIYVWLETGLTSPSIGIEVWAGGETPGDIKVSIDCDTTACTVTDDETSLLPLSDYVRLASLTDAGDGMEFRADVTQDFALPFGITHLAVYVESEGKRAYLTKPSTQVTNPCLEPACGINFTARVNQGE